MPVTGFGRITGCSATCRSYWCHPKSPPSWVRRRRQTTLLRAYAYASLREGAVMPTPDRLRTAGAACGPRLQRDRHGAAGRSHFRDASIHQAQRQGRALECLHEVGFRCRGQRYDRLSGRRGSSCCSARALASDCRILVLDEPASALDLANQVIVLRFDTAPCTSPRTGGSPDHPSSRSRVGIADKTLLMLHDAVHLVRPGRIVAHGR